jgi:hypothetical protein
MVILAVSRLRSNSVPVEAAGPGRVTSFRMQLFVRSVKLHGNNAVETVDAY